MENYGLLIDYEYCSGCRTCEVACQMLNGYDETKRGITLSTIGPIKMENGKWLFDNLPLHTAYCNGCHGRVKNGKLPGCVKHCQSGCIYYGKVEELIPKMNKKNMVLYTI